MSIKINSYKDLIVWQKSIEVVDMIYKITRELPKSEMYGLVSQMQRAAVAIPSNIAEGYKRNHRKEFIQFLSIANGSCAELETQLIIAKKQYSTINCAIIESLLNEIQKMLYAIMYKLRNV